MRKALILGTALLVAACGPRPSAQVEKVEICTEVGDYGMLVDAIEITVANPRSLKGLTAADFDILNNTSGAFLDAATGKPADAWFPSLRKVFPAPPWSSPWPTPTTATTPRSSRRRFSLSTAITPSRWLSSIL